MPEPTVLIESMQKDNLYQQWKKQHPRSYLSHFFCQLDNACQPKSEWEVGYFDPATEKITIFVPLNTGGFEIKPADDVFKKKNEKVEQLEIDRVRINPDTAQKACQAQLQSSFARLPLGDGFLILQTLQQIPVWNFTLITKTLQFVNIKINATNGEVEKEGIVNVVEQG